MDPECHQMDPKQSYLLPQFVVHKEPDYHQELLVTLSYRWHNINLFLSRCLLKTPLKTKIT